MLKKLKKAYYNICLSGDKTIQLESKINELSQKCDELNRQLVLILGNTNDLVHANFFHDTIKHSRWFDEPLSLSGWAIGYNYAYILYRVLDDMKPKRILELGLGQSTKIVNEYVKHHDNVEHHVVEHDKDWIEFFKNDTEISEMSHFHLLECYKKKYENVELNAYKGFKKEFKDQKFDLVVVDGPIGSGKEYSRMDVLDLVPENLAESFVILFDDCERKGEQNTIRLLEEKLRKNNIEFCSGYQYCGRTNAYICVSTDLKFLCSI